MSQLFATIKLIPNTFYVTSVRIKTLLKLNRVFKTEIVMRIVKSTKMKYKKIMDRAIILIINNKTVLPTKHTFINMISNSIDGIFAS